MKQLKKYTVIFLHCFLATCTTDGQQKKIPSTNGSVFSSTINPMEMLTSSVSSKNGLNIIDIATQERAISNWSMLYRKCMQEYRRHRLRKVAK